MTPLDTRAKALPPITTALLKPLAGDDSESRRTRSVWLLRGVLPAAFSIPSTHTRPRPSPLNRAVPKMARCHFPETLRSENRGTCDCPSLHALVTLPAVLPDSTRHLPLVHVKCHPFAQCTSHLSLPTEAAVVTTRGMHSAS